MGGKQQERPKRKFWENSFILAEEKQMEYSAALLVLFQGNKIIRYYLTDSLTSILFNLLGGWGGDNWVFIYSFIYF